MASHTAGNSGKTFMMFALGSILIVLILGGIFMYAESHKDINALSPAPMQSAPQSAPQSVP